VTSEQQDYALKTGLPRDRWIYHRLIQDSYQELKVISHPELPECVSKDGAAYGT
jgi:hypothetical protein